MANVPYRLQQVIYPFIKDTTCYYCIFIRGVFTGVILTALAIGVTAVSWVKFFN